jgi:hypothetical protein
VEPDNALKLVYHRPKGKGKGTLTATFPGGDTYTDAVDLADAADRERFIKALCKGLKGIDKKAVAAELESLASEEAEKAAGEGGARRSQSDVLLALAVGAELFHAPGNGDSEAFAAFTINEHKETWAVKSSGFRNWLARLYFLKTGRVPNAQALQDAIGVLAGNAMFAGPDLPGSSRPGLACG